MNFAAVFIAAVSFTFSLLLRVRVRCGSLCYNGLQSDYNEAAEKKNVQDNGATTNVNDVQSICNTSNERANQRLNNEIHKHTHILEKSSYRNCFKSESVWGNALKRFTTANNINIKFIILPRRMIVVVAFALFDFHFLSIHSLVFHFFFRHVYANTYTY